MKYTGELAIKMLELESRRTTICLPLGFLSRKAKRNRSVQRNIMFAQSSFLLQLGFYLALKNHVHREFCNLLSFLSNTALF
ncbi:MAG TPA: hypothetical protein DEF48_08350 [Nostoc sp. UBA8866]|nr:hypothetical protein [Nostoc sp. UBA8866]